MILHANHAAHHGHHSIMMRTVDTDVAVLAVSLAQNLGPGYKIGWHLELANISST